MANDRAKALSIDLKESSSWAVPLIGTSYAMQKVYREFHTAANNGFPVLLSGETGTGKELAARVIHFLGSRRARPFVPVDCAALTPTLIESELFGYVKGAFTGAQSSRTGLLEASNGGTVFLDEIGEMPLNCQAKLLRAVQEREIRRVGGNQSVHIDARFIAATNRHLEAEVKAGRFRQDLFFRLNVLQIKLPPLRERKDDITLLVKSFLEKYRDLQLSTRTVSEDALQCLMSYNWPGNVRELENAIQHALAIGSGPTVETVDLPFTLQSLSSEVSVSEQDEGLPLCETERRAIFRALRETDGDRLAAARLLNIGRTTLYRKLKEYRKAGSVADAGFGLRVS